MPTIVGILTFIGMINTYKSLKTRQRGDRAAYQPNRTMARLNRSVVVLDHLNNR